MSLTEEQKLKVKFYFSKLSGYHKRFEGWLSEFFLFLTSTTSEGHELELSILWHSNQRSDVMRIF